MLGEDLGKLSQVLILELKEKQCVGDTVSDFDFGLMYKRSDMLGEDLVKLSQILTLYL